VLKMLYGRCLTCILTMIALLAGQPVKTGDGAVMNNSDQGKRLIAKAEVLGKESGPDRTIVHRVLARWSVWMRSCPPPPPLKSTLPCCSSF
jgi:hypothetical protein